MKKAIKFNFFLCLGLMLAWFIFTAFRQHQFPKEFLGFHSTIRRSAFDWMLFDFFIVGLYLFGGVYVNSWSRLVICLYGLTGLTVLNLIPLFGQESTYFTIERVFGLYVWGSYIGFSISSGLKELK